MDSADPEYPLTGSSVSIGDCDVDGSECDNY